MADLRSVPTSTDILTRDDDVPEHFVVPKLVFRALAAHPEYNKAYLVYCALLTSRTPTVTLAELAGELDVSVRTVSRAIEALEALGLVGVESSGGTQVKQRRVLKLTEETRDRLAGLAARRDIASTQEATAQTSVTRSLDAAQVDMDVHMDTGVYMDMGVQLDMDVQSSRAPVVSSTKSIVSEQSELFNNTPTNNPTTPQTPGGLGGLAAPDWDDDLPPDNRQRHFDWTRLSPERQAAVTEVLAHWAEVYGQPNAQHSHKRRMRVNNRLKEFSVQQLKDAISAARRKVTRRTPADQLDIAYLCNTPERVEQLARVAAPERVAAIQQVFEAWQHAMGYEDRRLTDPRWAVISARLDEGFTVAQLIAIAQAAAVSPYHRGQNDQHALYDDVMSIFKDAERCEQWLAKIKHGLHTRTKVDRRFTHLAAKDTPPDTDMF